MGIEGFAVDIKDMADLKEALDRSHTQICDLVEAAEKRNDTDKVLLYYKLTAILEKAMDAIDALEVRS